MAILVVSLKFKPSDKMAIRKLINQADADKFEEFASKWSKNYKNLDEMKRKARNWKKNMKIIDEENKKNRGYKLGENIFTDMDDDEKAKYVMDIQSAQDSNAALDRVARRAKRGVIQTYATARADWRGKFMPAVRNQKSCGSCYAFAAINAIEVQWNSIPNNTFSEFSEQQIVDCSTGNRGCNGGWPHSVMDYSYSAGNVPQDAYPYTAVAGECQNLTGQKIVSNWFRLSSIQDMEYYLTNVGPLTFSMWVPRSIYLYRSGIFYPPLLECKPSYAVGAHAMTIVGFGTDPNDEQYWIVRNSWGANWGEGGYLRMPKGFDLCGMEGMYEWGVYVPWVYGQSAQQP
ncbi:unnamed protein product, partial [Mesorhabditis belari]|uniref:Uncharacterized protein n=1 Tax=Mesorhabditis belari TaxID=2138241 RepID=A0AAF3ET24_9BILA